MLANLLFLFYPLALLYRDKKRNLEFGKCWTYGNINAIIGKDESGVGGGELGVRHLDGLL